MKNLRFIILGLAFMVTNMVFAADEIHYTFTSQNSVTFDWRGTATENSISFGLSPGAYTQVKAIASSPAPNSSQGPFWEAKLTSLKENTLYYYAIGNGSERTFRTAPALGSSGFTVYAQGDIGDTSHSFNTGMVQDLIANGQPAFVIGLGDLTLGSANGKDAVDQHFNDVMAWSKEAAYMPVWGDQDWRKNTQDNFKNYKGRFDLPNPQTSPGTPLAGGEDWYWFDYGNVRFITLPEPWSGAWTDWGAKAGVLMAQAQADSNIKFIVTAVHRPAYSSGHFTGSAPLKEILNSLGDRHSKYVLNINSHSGNYERSYPQHGIVHVTAGIGGSNLRQDGTCLWLTCAKPSWSAFRTMRHGALKLKFNENTVEGSFICGPMGGGKNDLNCKQGSVADSFSIKPSATALLAGARKLVGKANNKKVTIKAETTVNNSSCNQINLDTSRILKDGGYAYKVNGPFNSKADNKKFKTQSTLRLFENGVAIGPAHAQLRVIRAIGRGRYSHWSLPNGKNELIRFAASNNTNPETNGKQYSYCLNTINNLTNVITQVQSNPAITPSIPAQGNQTTTPSIPVQSNSAATPSVPVQSNPTTPTAPVQNANPIIDSCVPAPTSSLVINVKNKGAEGNGSTDDTTAIQAAINQVGGTGGTVLIPDGTYMIQAAPQGLYPRSNMTIKMTSGAVLKAIPTSLEKYSILRIENVSNVNVIGGKLQGEREQHQGTSGEHGNGLSVLSSTNVAIQGVTATDMWGDGFFVGRASKQITICSVVADNNRRQGMSIVSGNGVIVKDSIFKNTNGTLPQSGVQIEPDANLVVSNVQILNSQMLNNKGWGIKLTSPAVNSSINTVTLDGNTVAGNGVGTGADGIGISRSSGHRISNNIVKLNHYAGISLVGGSLNNIVTGNTVSNNGASGVYQSSIGILMSSKATNNKVTNNTVTGHAKQNIRDFVGGNTIIPNILN
jgi:parallel beta-helix repeat protein